MGSGTWQDHPLGVPFVVLIGWCSVVIGSQTPGVLVLGPLGRGSGADQGQPLPVTSSGYLIGATKEFVLGSPLY